MYCFIVSVFTSQFCYVLLTASHFVVLQEHKFFEDAFKVYVVSFRVFKYPHERIPWFFYFDKFLNCYGRKKLERTWLDFFEYA